MGLLLSPQSCISAVVSLLFCSHQIQQVLLLLCKPHLLLSLAFDPLIPPVKGASFFFRQSNVNLMRVKICWEYGMQCRLGIIQHAYLLGSKFVDLEVCRVYSYEEKVWVEGKFICLLTCSDELASRLQAWIFLALFLLSSSDTALSCELPSIIKGQTEVKHVVQTSKLTCWQSGSLQGLQALHLQICGCHRGPTNVDN